MLEGLYSAASGMAAEQQQLDAVANDIANVDTPGYQAELLAFNDLLYTTGGYGSSVGTGAGVQAQSFGRSQIQGAIQQTGRPLDVAILGPGYLQVQRPDGSIALTRDGALELDSQGRLTTALGMPLQPPITLPPGTSPTDVRIAPDGTVSLGGRTLGRIALVTVPAPNGLLADGDSLFSPTAASGAVRPAAGATLQQGALEASNVDLAQEMVRMMDAERSYQLGSQAIQDQDQMLQIADEIKP